MEKYNKPAPIHSRGAQSERTQPITNYPSLDSEENSEPPAPRFRISIFNTTD